MLVNNATRYRMLPHFATLLEYFLVPWGVLLISYLLHDEFPLKYSSGTDFYVFFLSLDLNAILIYTAYLDRINPLFRGDYLAVFVSLVILSFGLLALAISTQNRLDAWRGRRTRSYPLTRIIICWVSTMTMIPIHLFIFFGS